MNQKVSDLVAQFLEEKGVRHVFGIIGSGNAHLFDSISKRGYTEIICVHHEQAAVMAMGTYFRTSGQISACLLTTGAGSLNGVTGVVSCWMDSLPGIIISGNENSKFTVPNNPLRAYGIQGYDSVAMVEKVTKYSKRVMDAKDVVYELEKSHDIALAGRMGPCWLDIPMNVQSAVVDPREIKKYERKEETKKVAGLESQLSRIEGMLAESERPLLWLGHGIRLSEATELIAPLLEKFQIPALVSWAGIDMIDSNHPLVFGRAGVYGQRASNFVLQNCDFLLTIGTRLAIPQIGYDLTELARAARIAVVDIDEKEFTKLGNRLSLGIHADAKDFMQGLLEMPLTKKIPSFQPWVEKCREYQKSYPAVGKEHDDTKEFINSYRFLQKLNDHFKADQVVVTDMGTALLSGHQVLNFKEGQRLMTSTGLGEMGYGLPAAIGASIARDRKEVMCLNCDGGMMMNLQELQTMVHLKLPIKLFIFNNDGYLMIKHTQKALFKGHYSGTNRESGVSCPNFSKLAKAFDLPCYQVRTWQDFNEVIPKVQAYDGPVICEVFMSPEQPLVPKLALAIQKDGSIISPPLEDLTPFIPREELKKNMIVGVHPKSAQINS